MGRPSLTPGRYFRLLLIGYFRGINGELDIAWRAEDSLALRRFLELELTEQPPDHSTISRTRRLIAVETHRAVFGWVLGLLAEKGLLKGKTLGIDATTLEANAAMRSIVRRDTGESYEEFLRRLAQASGIATPSREQLAKLDRRRKKKTSNEDWVNPHDPEAGITKIKDGRTHLAYKAEHVVDLEAGAVVAVTVATGEAGDTETMLETLPQAGGTPCGRGVRHESRRSGRTRASGRSGGSGGGQGASQQRHAGDAARSGSTNVCFGTGSWTAAMEGQAEAQQAVYGNRRRIQGEHGKQLLRRRGELLERSFSHADETGGMRRVYLRGRDNVLKRVLVHVGALNLSLVMRKMQGKGTPRGWQGYSAAVLLAWLRLWIEILALWSNIVHPGSPRSVSPIAGDELTSTTRC